MAASASAAARLAVPPAETSSAAPRNPALHDTPAESLVLVVAPTNGRFHPAVTRGCARRGDVLGHLTVGQGRRIEVPSPADLSVEGLLIRPGQLTTAGQALLWARRREADRG